MPDRETVAQMYGAAYETVASPSLHEPTDKEQSEPLTQWLSKLPRGTIVDFGCGDGGVLLHAQSLGWRSLGIELDPAVARRTFERTGIEVATDPRELARRLRADVLHMGDVIEHLTELPAQFASALELLRPGGVLLAQGPLEANANLFTLMVSARRRALGSPPAAFPPYHVILASAEGQRHFFQRAGITELEYRVTETAWPAPAKLTGQSLRQPRSLALYLLRKVSQQVSSLRPQAWGNRYFYAGRR